MKVIKTEFDGLLILSPSFHEDERGSFYESWSKEVYRKIGIEEEFLQDNFSVSYKNVLRGLHLQKDQGQLVTVVFGKIFDVVVDLRERSRTYKQHFSIELDGEDPKQLYMPPGFAHGFCVLSEVAIINYKCTQYYNSSSETRLGWNDSELKINWPVGSFILSEKDKEKSV